MTVPFSLRLPVIAAPMFLISGPDLVVASCRAGIIGAFPTPNCRTAADLDRWMTDITRRLDEARAACPAIPVAPWAANLVTHSSNTRLSEDLAVIARHKPPIVITALGSPKPAMEIVKSYGGIVIADVTTIRLAGKAVEAGADGLACVAAGAGGHTGHLSPFAFVTAVREFFDGLIIVGGGITHGISILGAIAAGADLVYMGTRFLTAEESLAPAGYKQMVIDCDADDLIISAAITGTPASWLKPSLIANGLDPANLKMPQGPRSYVSGEASHTKWKDIWAAGQGLQTIKSVQSTAGIVDELAHEYREAVGRCRRLTAEGLLF